MKSFDRYFSYARLSFRETNAERADVYGRMVFFFVILGVFSALWRAVAEAGMPLRASPKEMVWYLACTEWIVLSVPPLYALVQEEVRRGDVSYELTRPVSYAIAVLSRGAGQLAARAPWLALSAVASGFALTHTLPPLGNLLVAMALACLSATLLLVLYAGVGLLSFWMNDVTPVFWLVQKLLFVLGGLMLPLEFFPDWLRSCAKLTPFPWVLGRPAGLLLGATPSPDEVATIACALASWLALTLIAFFWLFRRATRSLESSGG